MTNLTSSGLITDGQSAALAREWRCAMGDIIRNIVLFVLVGGAILIGVLYIVSEINSGDRVSLEGSGPATSLSLST